MVTFKSTFQFFIPLIICSGLVFTQTGSNLEYEYSLLASWLILVTVPLYKGMVATRPLFSSQFLILCAASILLTYIPGSIMFLGDICKCSDRGWLFWHSFHIPLAVMTGHVLGDFATLVQSKYSRRVSVSALCVFILFQLFLIIFATYGQGMAKAHGFFYGFLHGPIYDKLIIVDNGTLRLQYLYILIGIAAVFGLSSVRTVNAKHQKVYQTISSLTVLVATFFWFDHDRYLSQKKTPDAIREVLSEVKKDGPITLHYDPLEISMSQATSVLDLSHFHHTDLTRSLGLAKDVPVDVFLYGSAIQKKKLFGGYRTDVADVRTPAIHISYRSFPHPTLRHELVHALLAHRAPLGLGFHPNMALTEGVASILAPNRHALDSHQAAGHLLKERKIKNPDLLFSPLFWLESGTRAYTAAKSFLGYILESYGPDKMLRLYEGQSFFKVFGKDASSITAEWKTFVADVYDEETYKIFADRYFSSKGTLRDTCPHTKESLRFDSENLHLFHPSKYTGKQNRLRYLTESFPNDPYYQYLKIRDEIKRGNLPSSEIKSKLAGQAKRIEGVYLRINHLDALVSERMIPEAHSALNELKELTNGKYLGSYLEMVLEIRERLLKGVSDKDLYWYDVLAGEQKNFQLPSPEDTLLYMIIYDLKRSVRPTLETMTQYMLDSELSYPLKYHWYGELFEESINQRKLEIATAMLSKLKEVMSSPSDTHVILMHERLLRWLKERS